MTSGKTASPNSDFFNILRNKIRHFFQLFLFSFQHCSAFQMRLWARALSRTGHQGLVSIVCFPSPWCRFRATKNYCLWLLFLGLINHQIATKKSLHDCRFLVFLSLFFFFKKRQIQPYSFSWELEFQIWQSSLKNLRISKLRNKWTFDSPAHLWLQNVLITHVH